jgi:hypothetical protein
MATPSFRKDTALAAVFLGAFILAVCPALAQDEFASDLSDKPTRPKATKERVTLLETQVDQLDETLKEVYGAEAPDYLRQRLLEIQGKIDDVSMQLSEIHEGSTNTEEVLKEQEARLNDIAQEVTALWEEIEALKKWVDKQLTESPPAGYKDGFYIKSFDDKFRLTINGFVRPYYRLGLQKIWKTDQYGNFIPGENNKPMDEKVDVRENTFGAANARLIIHAKFFEVLHGEFEIDYGTLAGTVQYPVNADVGDARQNRVKIDKHALRYLDAYGEYAPFEELKIRAGQFKVPFDLESQFDSNWLTFTTRSLITRAYPKWGEGETIAISDLTYNYDYEMQRAASFGRDLGFELRGCVAKGLLNYNVGMFNGGGDNVDNDNRDMLTALRLSTDPVGKMTAGMSDFETVEKPLVSIGAAFAYDLLEHNNPIDPTVQYNSADVNLTADAHFKWYGVSALVDLFYRHADHGIAFIDENGDPAPIDSVGTALQIAYFNDFTGLEPAFRYSVYDTDMNLKLDHVHEITAALAYYPIAPNLKVQAQYRGLFPAQTDHSYLAPWGIWFDYYNEITIMAQVSF